MGATGGEGLVDTLSRRDSKDGEDNSCIGHDDECEWDDNHRPSCGKYHQVINISVRAGQLQQSRYVTEKAGDYIVLTERQSGHE
jgi:hypothetical protein